MKSSFRHKVSPQRIRPCQAVCRPKPGRASQQPSRQQRIFRRGLSLSTLAQCGESRAPCAGLQRSLTAFTLIELLVVIAIIGILLTLGIPMIKGMNKSNSMTAANRQLLDDINYARQRAIADHTSVYIVFIPPTIINWTMPSDPAVARVVSNLYGGQYNTYALLSLRSVGEQPGRATPHYLTTWRTLPAGVYIATNKFVNNGSLPGMVPTFFFNSFNHSEFPFPVATNFASAKGDFILPHFGFNYLGQLIYRSNSMDNLVSTQGDSSTQMYIPLVRGSIFYQNNPDGSFAAVSPDVAETQSGNAYYAGYSYNTTNAQGGVALPPPYGSNNYNQIYIDPLTGRAKVQRLQIQ